jgi:putative SOS response-associated peptidase YedK
VCYSVLVQQDLKVLEREFGALPVRTQFEHFEQLCKSDPKHFQPMISDRRIYPNYFAPIVASKNDKTWVIPMRYRVRPMRSTDEIPAKYNVFNARLDSLKTRGTWSKLIGRNHGIVAIKEFYEWVVDADSVQANSSGGSPMNGRPMKKKIIGIRPANHEHMLTPVLWDWWESENKETSFFSFAVITGEPPADVLKAGHDRCPVFLSKEHAIMWLNPKNTRKNLPDESRQRQIIESDIESYAKSDVDADIDRSLSILGNMVESNYIIRTIEKNNN